MKGQLSLGEALAVTVPSSNLIFTNMIGTSPLFKQCVSVMSASTTRMNTPWLIDTGASEHVVNTCHYYTLGVKSL